MIEVANMKKTFLVILSLGLLFSLASCGSKDSPSSSVITSSNVASSSLEETSSSHEPIEVLRNKEIIFHSDNKEVDFSGKVNNKRPPKDPDYDVSKDPHPHLEPYPNEHFLRYFNESTDENLLASTDGNDYCEIKESETSKGVFEKHFCFGSRANNGTLTLNFNYDVHKVSFYLSPYYKIVNGNISSRDRNTIIELSVGEEVLVTKTLGDKTVDGLPEITTLTYDFENPARSFTISNIKGEDGLGHRVFLEKLELNYTYLI